MGENTSDGYLVESSIQPQVIPSFLFFLFSVGIITEHFVHSDQITLSERYPRLLSTGLKETTDFSSNEAVRGYDLGRQRSLSQPSLLSQMLNAELMPSHDSKHPILWTRASERNHQSHRTL